MTLEERLDADLRDAMRRAKGAQAGDSCGENALTEAKVAGEQARALSDQDVLNIIAKQVKQRRDSIAEFARAGRQDLVDQESGRDRRAPGLFCRRNWTRRPVRERARAVIAELGVSDRRASVR